MINPYEDELIQSIQGKKTTENIIVRSSMLENTYKLKGNTETY
jgi:hypothetical protein